VSGRPAMALVTRGLVAEHGALLRRLAQLQQRVGDQLQASARRQAALDGENIRLRGELVRMRTAVAWDLRPAALVPRAATGPRSRAPRIAPGLLEAQAVICQTGCAGHAHPWLEPDGQCRRTGQACDRLEDEGSARPAAAPRPGTTAA
jgi:hypothetical protein